MDVVATAASLAETVSRHMSQLVPDRRLEACRAMACSSRASETMSEPVRTRPFEEGILPAAAAETGIKGTPAAFQMPLKQHILLTL